MITLTQGMIAYFKDIHGYDVSNVTVIETSIGDGVKGSYSLESPNTVFIDPSECSRAFVINTTLVHEVAHMLQHERGISISLELDVCTDGVLMDASYHKAREWAVSWDNRPLEMDAILNEGYYLYYLNRDVDGMYDTVVSYLKSRLKNVTDIALLSDVISRIKVQEFKELAMHVLQ